MKFAIAFLLLIGISCQIGQGDCAPDSAYESAKSLMSGALSYTYDMYNSLASRVTPYTDPITNLLPPVPEVITDGLSDMSESMKETANDAEQMVEDGVGTIEDTMYED